MRIKKKVKPLGWGSIKFIIIYVHYIDVDRRQKTEDRGGRVLKSCNNKLINYYYYFY